MDKLFHFKAETNVSRQKSAGGHQYYSDAEADDSQSQERVVLNGKRQGDGGYATDENSDNENQLKATSKMNNGKVSKFKNFSAQQPDGDEGLAQEDDSNLETNKVHEAGKLKVKKSNSILENAKKEVASSSNKHSISQTPHKDMKSHLAGGTRQVDSDADVKKVAAINKSIDNLKNHQYRHLIFSNSITETSFKKHLSLVYRGLVYSHKCLKGPSDRYIQSKQVAVQKPKVPKGKTLFLDLDETLIHSCSLKDYPDHIIKTSDKFDGQTSQIGLCVRPYCLDFLSKMTQFWDIYIFTASSEAYAEAIINFIDPTRKYISGVLNRSNCMETKNGFYIKDLRIVKGVDLKNTILVDNLAHSFGFQIENGVPILEWHSDKSDQELKHLMNYLVEAAQSNDVREYNRENLKLMKLIQMQQEELGI